MKRTKDYQKVFKKYYGAIPKDDHGRSYDIHHIDGDHLNNDPSNLKAITIQEHYDIHYKQQDWTACQLILLRMNLTPEEISRKCSELANKRVLNGTHNWQDGKIQRATQNRLLASGEHLFLDVEATRKRTQKLIKEGKHNFIANHPNNTKVSCIVCRKITTQTALKAFHKH